MKNLLIITLSTLLLLTFNNSVFAGGGGSSGPTPLCTDAQPFCSDASNPAFPNQTNTSIPSGPDYGCLDDPNLNPMQNPQWFYFQISDAGTLQLNVSQEDNNGNGIDLDFVMWGPFPDLATGCQQVMAGQAPIQCSSDPTAIETIGLGVQGGGNYWYNQGLSSIDGTSTPPPGQVGLVYIVMLTNADGAAGSITLSQTGGSGATDCAITVPCQITNITTSPGACNSTDNTYTITGTVEFHDQPTTGSLVVKNCNGDSVIYSAPFTSPLSYSIPGAPANGGTCNVSAYFTESPFCTHTSVDFTAPSGCSCTPPNLTIDPITFCAGSSVDLNTAIDATSDPANNTFYNSQTDADNATNAISNTVTAAGTYWVRAENPSNSSCYNTFQIQVTTLALPTFTITQSDPTTCAGTDGLILISGLTPNTAYTYNYDGGGTLNATSDGSGNITIANLPAGTYTDFNVTLNGCTNSDNSSITLSDPNAPTVDAGANQTVCEGTQTTLTATNPDGASITWNNGITDGNPFNAPVGATTTYTVTAVKGGCTSTDEVDITVNSNPTPSIGVVANICQSENPITLSASPSGGVFSGTGVNSGQFDPSAANIGNNTINYQYTDANGCQGTASSQINVLENPTFSVNSNDPSCGLSDGTISINGLAANSNYSLNCNVGGFSVGPLPATTDGTGTITIDTLSSGTYINIEITGGNGCSTTSSNTITLTEPNPPAVTAPSDFSTCTGSSITLTATNPDGATISWDNSVNDGQAFVPPIAPISYPGSQTVVYTVTATTAGCSTTDQVQVTINANPSLSIDPVSDLCENGSAVTLTATPSGGTFSGTGVNGTQFSPINSGLGTFTIQYDYTDLNGCSSSVTSDINVVALPNFAIDTTNPACGTANGAFLITGLDNNTGYSYTYEHGGVTVGPISINSDNSGQVNIDTLSSGNYSNITISNVTGCAYTLPNSINLIEPNAPVVVAPQDIDICIGDSVTLTANNPDGGTISWSNGITDGVSFTPNTVGSSTFTVTSTIDNCSATDQVIVNVHGNPIPKFSADEDSGCAPLTVTFTDNTGLSNAQLSWDFGDGNTSSSSTSASNTYTSPGSYNVTLTVTSSYGCIGDTTYADFITVVAQPTASFTASLMITNTENTQITFTNSSQNAVTYSWDFGDNSTFDTVSNPQHNFPSENPGSYIVTLYATNNLGCSDSTTLTIQVTMPPMKYQIPNIFTPNGDGTNESFKLINYSGVKSVHVTIQNRWGNMVFEDNKVDFEWNGEKLNSGSNCDDGVYFYKMELEDFMGNKKLEYGYVHLNR